MPLAPRGPSLWATAVTVGLWLAFFACVQSQRPSEYVPLNSLTLKKLFRGNESLAAKDSPSEPSWWSTVENGRRNRHRYTFQPKTSDRLLTQFMDLYANNLSEIQPEQLRQELIYMINFFVINNYEVDKGHVFEDTFMRLSGGEVETRRENIPPQRQSLIENFVDEMLHQREVNDTTTFYPQLSKFATENPESESLETVRSTQQNSKIFSIKTYFTTPSTRRPTQGTTSKLDLSLPSNRTYEVAIKSTTTRRSTTSTTTTTRVTTPQPRPITIPPVLPSFTTSPEQSKISLQELLQNPNQKPTQPTPGSSPSTPSHIGLSFAGHERIRPVGVDSVSPFLYQNSNNGQRLQYFRQINKVPSPSSPQRQNITSAFLAVSPFITTEVIPRKSTIKDFSYVESPFLFKPDKPQSEVNYYNEPIESPFAVDIPEHYPPHPDLSVPIYPNHGNDDHILHADFNLHRASVNVPNPSLAERNHLKRRQGVTLSGSQNAQVKHPYDSSAAQGDLRTITTTERTDRLSFLNDFKLPKFEYGGELTSQHNQPRVIGRNNGAQPALLNSYVQLRQFTSRAPALVTTQRPTSRTRRPSMGPAIAMSQIQLRQRGAGSRPSSSDNRPPVIANRAVSTTPITPFSNPKRPRLQTSLKAPSAIASLFSSGVEIQTADAQTQPLLQTISSSGPIDLPPSLLIHGNLNKYAVSEPSRSNQPRNRNSNTNPVSNTQSPRQINRETQVPKRQNRWRDILTKESSANEKVKLKELKELRNQNLLLLQILQNAFGEENRRASFGRRSSKFANAPRIIPLGFGRHKEPEPDRFTILNAQEIPSPDSRRQIR